MTTISTLIRDAYRESNLIAASADPTTAEIAEGVTVLNQFIGSLFGHEAGEELVDVSIANATATLRSNERALVSYNTAGVTITLPATPDNGARVQIIDTVIGGSRTITVSPNGRKVLGAATLVLAAGSNKILMYRADLGDWLQIAPLSSSDTLPFPTDYEPLFIVAIAVRLNPRHGQTVGEGTMAVFERDMERLKFDYRQTGQSDEPRTRALLNRALRLADLVPDAGQPRAAQLSDALRRLNATINSLFGEELGELLVDQTYADYQASGRTFAQINTRLVGSLDTGLTVKLDPNPYNGSRFSILGDFSGASITIDANGRSIEDVDALTFSIDDISREWFYRSDLGTWVRLTPLTLTDDPPFPEEFDQLLEIQTAVRLAPGALNDTLLMAARRMTSQFKNRYRQSVQMPSELALLLLNDERVYQNSADIFGTGRLDPLFSLGRRW